MSTFNSCSGKTFQVFFCVAMLTNVSIYDYLVFLTSVFSVVITTINSHVTGTIQMLISRS